jgi:ABC-type multidrug transport system ATPase subunit
MPDCIIKIEDLRKSFGMHQVLNGVDLTIDEGELLVLLGPNGSGKSTLFRSILGLIDYEGSIAVDGKSPLVSGKAVRGEIGYMPQQSGLHSDLTVEETLGFYAMIRKVDAEIAFRLLEKVALGHTRHLRVGELSGGMRQRLAYVVAAFSSPKILILDEPIANLDRDSQALILSHLLELHEQKCTIILSTHLQHDLLEFADRSVVMEEGRLWDSALLAEWHASKTSRKAEA